MQLFQVKLVGTAASFTTGKATHIYLALCQPPSWTDANIVSQRSPSDRIRKSFNMLASNRVVARPLAGGPAKDRALLYGKDTCGLPRVFYFLQPCLVPCLSSQCLHPDSILMSHELITNELPSAGTLQDSGSMTWDFKKALKYGYGWSFLVLVLVENAFRDQKGRGRGRKGGRGEKNEGGRRKTEKIPRALVFLMENVKKIVRIYFNT